MYVRRPLAQHSTPRRRLRRWSGPSTAPDIRTAIASAAAGPLTGPAVDNDFHHYVRCECGDVLFSHAGGLRTAALSASSSAHGPPPSASASLHGSLLHCGPEVAALPASHALLNNVNGAVWLRVLTCLRDRGALTSRDCAGVIRYLPALTYHPLLPWLWAPAAAATTAEWVVQGGDATQQMRNAPLRLEGSDEGGGQISLPPTAVDAAEAADVTAEVYSNMMLVALERARRVPAPAGVTASAAASAGVVYEVADLTTADPQLWVAMSHALVSDLPSAATRRDRLKLWHDILFTLRSHSTWNTTATALRDVGHPQLLRVFQAFYLDMRRQETTTTEEEAAAAVRVEVSSRSRSTSVASLEITTLTPPLLLHKFRALYRRHKHSSMLFAELYAYCVQQEETTVQWRRRSSVPSAAVATAASSAGRSPVVSSEAETRVVRLGTTALLMNVDLAVYYASLPGRRDSGLDTPAEQWAATLRHLRFLLPRLHLLQRCLHAQHSSASSSLPSLPLSAELWEPWKRVASVLMNVCVWVENNDEEAERCCAALRTVVEALQNLATSSPPTAEGISGALRLAAVHTLLGAPTTTDISIFITTLVEAAGESMRAKAVQLHYGPTDGLFGIALLSVAVSAVVPAGPARQQQQQQQQQQAHRQPSSQDAPLNGRNGDTKLAEESKRAEFEDTAERLRQLQLLTHASKASPRPIWSALRRTPHAKDAARYGLVTIGYRLFRDCVVPSTTHTATFSTARRVLALLCAWASEVGQPLGLRGEQAPTLWQLRWSQAQQKERCGEEANPTPHYGRRHRSEEVSLVQQLIATWHSSSPHRGGRSDARPDAEEWVCGCGFRNVGGDADVSCVACVLRDLVPHCWECPSCHTVADSGARVPYCLHCGEAHPALRHQQRRDHHDIEEEEPRTAEHGLVHVCGACHTVSAKAPFLSHASLPNADRQGNGGPDKDAQRSSGCDVCGRHDTGYYTAAFAWTCCCGASNSALHDYCHACSRAARTPTLTCPQCHYTETTTSITGGRCTRCSFPHPRRLAAVQQSRLVRCPACQGLAPSTSLSCPHCANTAIGVVAAFLPTVADQPWLCLHCGASHSVRDAETGVLRAPPPLHVTGLAVKERSMLPPSPSSSPDCHGEGVDSGWNDDVCDRCGTQRVAAATWEPSRLWSCTACGEVYNTEAACRRCAALAPGVPVSAVHVWQCEVCRADHPSWEAECATAGCGGSARAPDRRTDSAKATHYNDYYCYSPWECPECGEVTLSSHLSCCTHCGATTPTAVLHATCTSGTCVKAAVLDDSVGIEKATRVVAVVDAPAAAPFDAVAQRHGSRAGPASRLAQVEAFLLCAAAAESPLQAAMRDTCVVPTVHGGSLWPAAAPMEKAFSSVNGGDEAWEEAYGAAVLRF